MVWLKNILKTPFPKDRPKSSCPYPNQGAGLKKKLIAWKDNESIVSEGWLLLEINKDPASGEAISITNFNYADCYNSTIPGTFMIILLDERVYPQPDCGVINMVIPDAPYDLENTGS